MGVTGLEAGRLGAASFSRLRGGPVLSLVPAAAGSWPSLAQATLSSERREDRPLALLLGRRPAGCGGEIPSALKVSGIRPAPPGDHRPSLRLQILHLSTSAQSLSPCKVMHVHHGDQGLFSRGSIFCLPRPIKKKKHDLTPRVFEELLLGA